MFESENVCKHLLYLREPQYLNRSNRFKADRKTGNRFRSTYGRKNTNKYFNVTINN